MTSASSGIPNLALSLQETVRTSNSYVARPSYINNKQRKWHQLSLECQTQLALALNDYQKLYEQATFSDTPTTKQLCKRVNYISFPWNRKCLCNIQVYIICKRTRSIFDLTFHLHPTHFRRSYHNSDSPNSRVKLHNMAPFQHGLLQSNGVPQHSANLKFQTRWYPFCTSFLHLM